MRAVRWPAGRHTLVMRYEPPELGIGLALSGAGALLIAVLAGLAIARRSSRVGGHAFEEAGRPRADAESARR